MAGSRAGTIGGLRAWLGALGLTARFALTGSVVMLAAALIGGIWVTEIIARSAIASTAGATALFMDSIIGPLAQELEQSDTLSIGPSRAIEEVMAASALGQRVVSVKIWKPGGLVAYSEDNQLIGRRFPPSPSLQRAFAGEIVAELDQLDDVESAGELSTGLPLLEIYSPIRKPWSGEIIAVGEFYEDATELNVTLRDARVHTWLIVLAMAVLLAVTLLGIVHRASKVIDQQGRALAARAAEAERVSQQNRLLRLRVERAAGRAAEMNERFLRRISADLHDGPAQLISLAALRLAGLAKAEDAQVRLGERDVVKRALDEAMREIRAICSGLSLPDIDGAPLSEVVANAVRAHEHYTGTAVALRIGALPVAVTPAVKICAFRFVQEGLNNAFRHAAGVGQRVEAGLEGAMLTVTVANAPADGVATPAEGGGLGLSGLRERVESLGGSFAFEAPAGQEVRMTMSIGPGTGAGDG
jgi:signal transduction histidine kinase